MIEWLDGEKEPIKYWLSMSTLQQDVAFRQLVGIAKLRWRIERDYQELKQEVGLGHFEGRGWRGFHHHATLCIAAYGFLISERETIPPQEIVPPRCSPICLTRRLPTQRICRLQSSSERGVQAANNAIDAHIGHRQPLPPDQACAAIVRTLDDATGHRDSNREAVRRGLIACRLFATGTSSSPATPADPLADIEPNPRGITRAEVEAAIADWCNTHMQAPLCQKLLR